MNLPLATLCGVGSLLWAAVLAHLGRRRMKLARLVRRTPTTIAASDQGGDLVEITGLVVAAERTLPTLRVAKNAVWVHQEVEEFQPGDDPKWVTVLRRTEGVEFLVDDRSGRMARVIVRSHEDAVVTAGMPPLKLGPGPRREGVHALLESCHVRVAPHNELRFTERALYVGEPVYVLGPARVATGSPVAAGYRSSPSSQLVLRDIMGLAPLTVAAMTEESFVDHLTGSAVRRYGGAVIVLVIGLVLSVLAAATSLADCYQGNDLNTQRNGDGRRTERIPCPS